MVYVSRPGHRDHAHLIELIRASDELAALMEEGERADG
jgi:hypothetical protein